MQEATCKKVYFIHRDNRKKGSLHMLCFSFCTCSFKKYQINGSKCSFRTLLLKVFHFIPIDNVGQSTEDPYSLVLAQTVSPVILHLLHLPSVSVWCSLILLPQSICLCVLSMVFVPQVTLFFVGFSGHCPIVAVVARMLLPFCLGVRVFWYPGVVSHSLVSHFTGSLSFVFYLRFCWFCPVFRPVLLVPPMARVHAPNRCVWLAA